MPNYRVVQWATGNIGSRALRAVIEHPGLTLVGVYAHTADKVGRAAGELCGLDAKQGEAAVRATDDIEQILALGADCVLYMPLACDIDEVCRVLAAGANIVTTRGEFHCPAEMDPIARAAVEVACSLGGVSIHSTGSSPGFITEAVPQVLTSIQRRLDAVRIDEYADLSRRDSPDILFQIMGFCGPPAEFAARRLDQIRRSFGPSLRVLANGLGLHVDSIEVAGECAVARERLTIAAGTIEAGTVAGQRITVSCMTDGRSRVSFRANWYCTTDLDPAWDLRDTGWRVSVAGDAPLDVDLRFAIPLERMADTAPGYTANRAVNAIPYVCAATPGIRTTLDLPTITPTFT